MYLPQLSSRQLSVALLAEGVDRNIDDYMYTILDILSPSSRRAWIEIWVKQKKRRGCQVALLAEGVDRNLLLGFGFGSIRVALLAEGVDRNGYQEAWADYRYSRPPRGGRG